MYVYFDDRFESALERVATSWLSALRSRAEFIPVLTDFISRKFITKAFRTEIVRFKLFGILGL